MGEHNFGGPTEEEDVCLLGCLSSFLFPLVLHSSGLSSLQPCSAKPDPGFQFDHPIKALLGDQTFSWELIFALISGANCILFSWGRIQTPVIWKPRNCF